MERESPVEISAAARVVSDAVRTTLGPFGANKCLLEEDGTVTVTSSASAVIDRLEIEHPAVSVFRTAAKNFEARNGDGAGTLATLVGALLDEADDLSEQGLSPAEITRGFYLAYDAADTRLDEIARPLSTDGTAAVARTALTGTRDQHVRQSVGELIADIYGEYRDLNPRNVSVVTRLGGALSETYLVRGTIIDDKPVSEVMPRRLENTGVALLTSTVDLPRLGGETKNRGGPTNVSLAGESLDDRVALNEYEREAFDASVAQVAEAGCRFIATTRAVNDRVKTRLANHGITALQRVDEDDVVHLSRTTGAHAVPSLNYVSEETLGRADVTVERKAGRDMTVIQSTDSEPTFTLFCRAPDPRSADTFSDSVESALAAAASATKSGTVVPGGGASEMSAAQAIRKRGRGVQGTEQLAMAAFADALERVPGTLAANAGLDRFDAIVQLHVAHGQGESATGVDCLEGRLRRVDVEDPIIEPTELKRQVWSSATELATRLVRIDDILPKVTDTESPPDGDAVES